MKQTRRNTGRELTVRGENPVLQRFLPPTFCALTAAHLYYQAVLAETPVVVAIGPSGTRKTYGAVENGYKALREGKVGKLIVARPTVKAGEDLGFLPGEMDDKLAPFLRPLFDILAEIVPGGPREVNYLRATGKIEIVPIAFMRGRTFNNAAIIIDEAQNCTYGQLKMILTRLGHNARFAITGDPDQIDLPEGKSGLMDMVKKLEPLSRVKIVRFSEQDVVRHPLVIEVLAALNTLPAQQEIFGHTQLLLEGPSRYLLQAPTSGQLLSPEPGSKSL